MNNIAFDPEKFYLGKLCVHGHDWNGTGQSLRRKINRNCCKCDAERTKKWRKINKEKVSEFNREYSRKNRVRLSDKKRERYQENPELARQKRRLYCQKNRDKVREWDRNHYYKNRPAILARAKKWREENKDCIKQYRGSNNGKIANIKAINKRKSLMISNHHFGYSIQEVSTRLQDFDSSCAYCGSNLKVTLDHFIPLSKGGPDCIGNLVPACSRCNTSKHARDVREWYQQQEFYSQKRWRKILKVLGKTDANYNQIPLL